MRPRALTVLVNVQTMRGMRVGFVSETRAKVGGVEHYLERILEDLHQLGHDVSLLCETSAPPAFPEVRLPAGAHFFAIDALGEGEAVRAFFAASPDLVYVHGVSDRLERAIVGRRPTVYFAHNYRDTCISGRKMHRLPLARPCDRTFGPACLALFYPCRCGGLNPRSMLSMYRDKHRRLRTLPLYDGIATHSEHMRAEYVKHRLAPDRIATIPFTSSLPESPDVEAARKRAASFRAVLAARDARTKPALPLRVLFAARCSRPKGGDFLIDALPRVADGLGVEVRAVIAGTGPMHAAWVAKARAVSAKDRRVTIELPGLLGGADVRARMAESHLLAFPSVWPEPYGMSGVEALARGLPVVGFAVGAVPEWLRDGENGCLASGDPPTARGLADAMLRATRDAGTFASLCEGAVRSMEGKVPALHARELLRYFESVLASARGRSEAVGGSIAIGGSGARLGVVT